MHSDETSELGSEEPVFDLTVGGRVKLIDKSFTDALKLLHRRLDGLGLTWIIGGDFAEALQVVQVDPECIEILTNANDARKIFSAVNDVHPRPITYLEQRQTRNAVIEGKEYPVTVRSHYLEFALNGTQVKVYGNKQFRIDDWDWGDVLEFEPKYVNVVGQRTAVIPLSIQLELYEKLGWTDRVEKINCATSFLKHGPR